MLATQNIFLKNEYLSYLNKSISLNVKYPFTKTLFQQDEHEKVMVHIKLYEYTQADLHFCCIF